MIIIKNKSEIKKLYRSNQVVAEVLKTIKNKIKKDITTLDLNEIAENIIYKKGGKPGFKGYRGFPFSICASVNDAIVHGFPNDKPLMDGDIVSIDVGVIMEGYYGDGAITVAVGEAGRQAGRLIRATEECLYIGINKAIPNNRIGDIGHAIQNYAEKNGFNVIRNYVGHGIGRVLHELPQVKNYGKKGRGPLIKEGMTIAIEPMLVVGSYQTKTDRDGWCVRTIDGGLSAHFEHTIEITSGKPNILSKF
jgi:methionyl aminopeptidase